MSSPIKFGVGAGSVDGPPVWEIAKRAEDLGYDSLWIGQHIAIPVDIANPVRNGVRLPPSYRQMPDPFIMLAAAAAATTTIKLGTNICLVGQLDPINLAKQIATLDQISGGRVIVAIGTGWIVEELEMMGVPFKRRWDVAREHCEAMQALWTEDESSYSGEFVSFPPVYSYPKPVQAPHPPLLLGAGNPNIDNSLWLKRLVESDWAGGWSPNFFFPHQMKQQLDDLRERCATAGRDFDSLQINMLMPASNLGWGDMAVNDTVIRGDLTDRDPLEVIAEYAEAGLTRILLGLGPTKDEGFKLMEDVAKKLGLV